MIDDDEHRRVIGQVITLSFFSMRLHAAACDCRTAQVSSSNAVNPAVSDGLDFPPAAMMGGLVNAPSRPPLSDRRPSTFTALVTPRRGGYELAAVLADWKAGKYK
ncbi:hypothetical protein [Rhizobium sp. Leaf383]|uniref:hypothetical protein n=1 Tax=Rhizobium sp. Leaf383 TaxID=1736357 RepID=UPI0012E3F5B5|nr:hypothetical protein [Rhizobium sp. Leaf383]